MSPTPAYKWAAADKAAARLQTARDGFLDSLRIEYPPGMGEWDRNDVAIVTRYGFDYDLISRLRDLAAKGSATPSQLADAVDAAIAYAQKARDERIAALTHPSDAAAATQ